MKYILTAVNVIVGGYIFYSGIVFVKQKYYYCHSTSLGDLTLLAKATSIHEANKQLIEYLRWTGMLGTGLLVCSEVYNPEK